VKRMKSMIDSANRLISELGVVRHVVGPLNIDECLSGSGYVRFALWSAQEREDLLALACHLAFERGEALWNQSFATDHEDGTQCELEIISHELFVIGDTLATYGRLNPPAFRLQINPTIN
jgi:hypothetical protein